MNFIVPPKIYLLVQTCESVRDATETREKDSTLASCSAENVRNLCWNGMLRFTVWRIIKIQTWYSQAIHRPMSAVMVELQVDPRSSQL